LSDEAAYSCLARGRQQRVGALRPQLAGLGQYLVDVAAELCVCECGRLVHDRLGLLLEHGLAHRSGVEQIEQHRLRPVLPHRLGARRRVVGTEATRQLASRARRRVRAADPLPDADLRAQWEVVEAFIAAAREGDFEALVAVLDPDVVLRADGGRTGLSQHLRAAETVASQALRWSRVDLAMRRALVNGAAGIVTFLHGQPFSIAAVTIKNRKIVEIDLLADPGRIAQLDLTFLGR
jgi:hypothetical protein